MNLHPADQTGDRGAPARSRVALADPSVVAGSLAAYRRYIRRSRAELSCPKPIHRDLRTGWFSDRSAAYLASGRPVLTEDTGLTQVLPTGEGLLAFQTIEEAATAVEEIDAHYPRHARAAREVAMAAPRFPTVAAGDAGRLPAIGRGVRPVQPSRGSFDAAATTLLAGIRRPQWAWARSADGVAVARCQRLIPASASKRWSTRAAWKCSTATAGGPPWSDGVLPRPVCRVGGMRWEAMNVWPVDTTPMRHDLKARRSCLPAVKALIEGVPAWPARTPIDEPSEGKPFEEGLARSAANHAALTPAGFLERAAAVYPNKPAIIHDARVYSYAEFAGVGRAARRALLPPPPGV